MARQHDFIQHMETRASQQGRDFNDPLHVTNRTVLSGLALSLIAVFLIIVCVASFA